MTWRKLDACIKLGTVRYESLPKRKLWASLKGKCLNTLRRDSGLPFSSPLKTLSNLCQLLTQCQRSIRPCQTPYPSTRTCRRVCCSFASTSTDHPCIPPSSSGCTSFALLRFSAHVRQHSQNGTGPGIWTHTPCASRHREENWNMERP